MASGAPDEAGFSGGKFAKTGKDGKSAKEPKEGKKPKVESASGSTGEGKNSDLLRQLTADLAAVSASLGRLQSDVDTLKGLSESSPTASGERGKRRGKGRISASYSSGLTDALRDALASAPSAAVAVVVPDADPAGTPDSAFVCAPDLTSLSTVDTAQVAKLGYAFSSVPKVALLRLLLENGEQTAAQLGEGAGLTTGSLYHHLRELVHAEVAHQSSRNHYALTDLGRRTVLVLLALQN